MQQIGPDQKQRYRGGWPGVGPLWPICIGLLFGLSSKAGGCRAKCLALTFTPAIRLAYRVRDALNQRFLAYVRLARMQRFARVQVGDDIAGWQVTEIEVGRIVSLLGDREVTFARFKEKDRFEKGWKE